MTLSKAEQRQLIKIKRRSHICTPEQREAGVRMYLNGSTLREVAAKYGVSVPSVHGWVTRARIRAREAK